MDIFCYKQIPLQRRGAEGVVVLLLNTNKTLRWSGFVWSGIHLLQRSHSYGAYERLQTTDCRLQTNEK